MTSRLQQVGIDEELSCERRTLAERGGVAVAVWCGVVWRRRYYAEGEDSYR